MKRQEVCTCEEHFSIKCPTHAKQNCDEARQDSLTLLSRNRDTIENMEKKNKEPSFEGLICDCQVYLVNIYHLL